MKYLLAAEIAEKWGVSPRTVRNYCTGGKIPGAYQKGKCWLIPESAKRPERTNKQIESNTLLTRLKEEKQGKVRGGIYHKIQIELTYNSNHMEGSQLTHDQTRYIYETNTIGITEGTLNVDDIIETANHFKCIDKVIDFANRALSEAFIKELHYNLKSGTADARKDWFMIGAYKKLPNEVGGKETTPPEQVAEKIKLLLSDYKSPKKKKFSELLDFHVAFENIHPFQDGNGRVGRLILFKECLQNDIVPFIIDEELKLYYYRGLQEWEREPGYLTDTCLAAQDKFKKYLDYFRISYPKEP